MACFLQSCNAQCSFLLIYIWLSFSFLTKNTDGIKLDLNKNCTINLEKKIKKKTHLINHLVMVTVGACADSRRWTDVLNLCKTLDFQAALWKESYIPSRQALYHCLIPQRADSQEGTCHVRRVPVILRKAKNTLCNKHADADFIFAIKRQMCDIVSLFDIRRGNRNSITKYTHNRDFDQLLGLKDYCTAPFIEQLLL